MIFDKAEAEALIHWYQDHKRDLPWRDTGDPYDVWLSEIMLQQTRVEFVKERFLAFKQAVPDIPSLAEIPDDQLMKLWEGMGYYSRARSLKKCARILCEQYGGRLPQDVKSLLALPGIGPYTAGAIASIAANQPVCAVDGNVLRVLARRQGDRSDIRSVETRNRYSADIQCFYDENWASMKQEYPTLPSLLNQALMELGALVCVPNGAPHCEECPWNGVCQACLDHTVDEIPYRSPLKKRQIVQRTILVIRDGERFLLHRRSDTGLLAGLYEFPGVDAELTESEALDTVRQLGLEPLRIQKLPNSRHVFSHVEWHMQAYEIQTADMESFDREDYQMLTRKELQRFAVPSAFHAYKEYYSLNDQF